MPTFIDVNNESVAVELAEYKTEASELFLIVVHEGCLRARAELQDEYLFAVMWATNRWLLLAKPKTSLRINGVAILGLCTLNHNEVIDVQTYTLKFHDDIYERPIEPGSEFIGFIDKYTGIKLQEGMSVITCPGCKVPYIAEVWKEKQSCAVGNCRYRVYQPSDRVTLGL